MKRIAEIEIVNVKGIPRLKFGCGSVNVFRGDNGTGKSSILDALFQVFEGGHDPSLIRKGTDSAEVVISFDDKAWIRKRITASGYKLEGERADGTALKAPKEYLDSLSRAFSFDPVSFLDSSPKNKQARLKFLIEAMGIRFAAADVARITGQEFPRDLELAELEVVRKDAYSRRTNLNTAARDLAGTISTAEQSLMPADEAAIDWDGQVAQLEAERQRISNELAAGESSLDVQAERQRCAVRDWERDEIAKIRVEAQRRLDTIEEKQAEVWRQGSEEMSTDLQRLAGELATAKAKRDEKLRDKGARKNLEAFRSQLTEKSGQAAILTDQINALDELKASVMENLPIEGCDIRDGEILVDGIPLDNLNTQAQWFFVAQVAALAQTEMKFQVFDNLEAIVGDNWESFKAGFSGSDIQVFGARAEAGQPLSMERDGELLPLDPAAEAEEGKRTRRKKGA